MNRFWEFVVFKTFKWCPIALLALLLANVALVKVFPSSIGEMFHVDLPSHLIFIKSLTPNLVSAAIVFVVGLSWTRIRKSLLNARARFFWGGSLFDGPFAISHGTLLDERLLTPGNEPRFVKQYHDDRILTVNGLFGKVLGECEVRSIAYLLNTLSKYRQEPVSIESDTVAYAKLNRTLISLGSPVSNEVTELILNESGNRFCSFDHDEKGPFIFLKQEALKVRPSGTPRKDLGVILKIRNTRFPDHYLYVCAGLGEWGTSGAAWYLANNWRNLDDLGEQFGRIVQVEIGSDESARPISFVASNEPSRSPKELPDAQPNAHSGIAVGGDSGTSNQVGSSTEG